ncbi:MAG TPA: hypothetical protein VF711_12710 [Acidimicrobiales bacterium]|jgi:hypothetical protein
MRDPVWLARRAVYKVRETLRPNDPWLAPKAISYLDGALRPDWVGFEWGSGRSTTWFAGRLSSLISIEHDPGWHAHVERSTAGLLNVEVRLIPLDHPPAETGEPRYDSLPGYVAAVDDVPDGSLDVVLVDGAYRQPCVAAALPKLRTGGLLIIDNTDWLPIAEWGVPESWPIRHQSHNVITQTTVWASVGV